MSLKENIIEERVPRHVAIIMDGNGRWAKNRGEQRIVGHMNGVKGVRQALTAASEIGVKYLTLYAFSTENWDRPKQEVSALMDLLVKTILKELDELHENEVRLEAIGDLNKLPEDARNALLEAVDKTSSNKRITLILALSYSSRWELTEAVRNISQQVNNGELSIGDITPDTISKQLSTISYPDPELLIRTSGEQRISNFLLWQIAYSELYFTPVLWPDFTKEDFFKAIIDYQNRERRFGKISEQTAIQ